ncbi:MAG: hypothetical protein ACYC9D_13040 [Candidatus Dormibacteria bacterium]
MEWAGKYAAAKKPDSIIWIGDGPDMPSLSSYDVGKKCFEGRTYKADIDSFKEGTKLLMAPIRAEQARLRKNKGKPWNPNLIYVDGNHDQRIVKAIESDRKLEGLISLKDRGLEKHGWNIFPFLEIVIIDGIAYSHYFTSGILGRPVTSARALVTKKHMSCVMGHVQRAEIDFQYDAKGKRLTGIFTGCYYQHDEDYLGPQGNQGTWRGIWMFYNVKDGEFTHNNVPISFLKDRYGKSK